MIYHFLLIKRPRFVSPHIFHIRQSRFHYTLGSAEESVFYYIARLRRRYHRREESRDFSVIAYIVPRESQIRRTAPLCDQLQFAYRVGVTTIDKSPITDSSDGKPRGGDPRSQISRRA